MLLHRARKSVRLKRLFYRVTNRFSRNALHISRSNRLSVEGVKIRSSEIKIEGTGCHVSIGEGAYILNSTIEVQGTGCQLIIGRNARIRHAHLLIQDMETWLKIGENTTMTGARLLVAGRRKGVSIGEGCMVGVGVAIRNSDMHSIIDVASEERLNHDRSVVIGDHVWIGESSQIMKGSEIGDHCVIGASSLVLGRLEGPGRIYAGNPAREKRSGVTWKRTR
jgi:acetyltransferase-like isoleucine patch superfamily enzyme